MPVRAPNRRAFEHALRAPSPQSTSGESPARKLLYRRLVQVSIQHAYYNASGGDCPDFVARPTPASAALMADLGLLFRDEGSGFSVLYDERREESLQRYLRRQEAGDPRSAWTRLSFVLALDNPYFVNLTAIPLDTNPLYKNFYFTNRQAHEEGGEILLSRGERVDAAELVEVIPVQLAVPVSPEVREVVVRAISGEVVLCAPRCVKASSVTRKSPGAFNCKDDAGEDVCRETIYLDFSSLPEDRYGIEKIGYDGRPVARREVLYTAVDPLPLCFVDLLLADPGGSPAGLYPVRDLFPPPGGRTTIAAVHYVLRFANRRTRWSYYVVPPPEPFGSWSLYVESSPEVAFAGPVDVVLPTGARCYRLVAEEPLPLEQQSDLRFRLWGRSALMTHDRILMDRLPVASCQQVTPGTPDRSDIYVYV